MPAAESAYDVRPLNGGKPLITRAHFEALGVGEEGSNINGASILRLPEWLPNEKRADPSAKYYLYFSHHRGRYIRLAWAASLEGPWTLYGSGKDIAVGERGVLDMGADRKIRLSKELQILDHIASPDVHVDEEKKLFRMYVHGVGNLKTPEPLPDWVKNTGLKQRNYVAESADGLDFNDGLLPVCLGHFYFKVFEAHGRKHAFTNRAVMHRAPEGQDPLLPPEGTDLLQDYWAWEPGYSERLYNWLRASTGVEEPRHVGIQQREDGLRVFLTQVYGEPERILAVDLDFNGSSDWKKWSLRQQHPIEVYRPSQKWEGIEVPVTPSRNGPAKQLEHALRDPDVLEDEGRLYLFYSGGGEAAIGAIELR